MKYRKLRIAWSVAWCIACLLVVVLWVRSYWWWDYAMRCTRSWGPVLTVQSVQGSLLAYSAKDVAGETYRVGIVDVEPQLAFSTLKIQPILGFYYKNDRIQTLATIPHWFALLCAGFIAAAPWLRWQYSLRTLLIGMTVAAIGLGWVVYVMR